MAKTVNGVLQRDSLSDIRTKLRAKAVDIFQEVTPYGQSVDTDPASILGRWIDINAEAKYDLEEITEYLINMSDLDSAEDNKLEDITSLGGVDRLQATPSQVLLVVVAKPYTVIPSGSFVKSAYTNDTFSTDYEIQIQSTQGEGGVFGYDLSVADSSDPTFNYIFKWQRDSSPSTNIDVNVQRGTGTFESFLQSLADVINQTTSDVFAEISSDSYLKIITTDYNEEISLSLTNSQIINVYQGVEATSTNLGAISADAGTLTAIQSPVNGWISVVNPFDASIGSEIQTDEELRDYYKAAKNFGGSSTLNALKASLYRISGVKYVSINENTSNISGTMPSHSFSAVVLGGKRDDIAQTILENKPVGINSFGTSEGNAVDINGNNYTMYFSRPEFVPITIRISLTQQAGFENSNYDQIRQNIINYLNTMQYGGGVVSISRLYTPINAVPNHYINSLEIGRIVNGIPEYGNANIVLQYNEVPTINPENIQFY